MPDETVIDGEIMALDESGRPSFNVLQNYGSSPAPVFDYVFDVMMVCGFEVMYEPLVRRRELLQERVLNKLDEPIRLSPMPEGNLDACAAASP
jgi:ATP-dependent DNA ligase